MQRSHALSILVAAVLATAVCPRNARADTVHVPSEHPTIQAGIDAAGPGGTVLVAAGTYSGAGNTGIDMRGFSATVSGAGVGATVIDCASSSRAFTLSSPDDSLAVIENLTVQNGSATLGGAISISAASPTIRDCAFESCAADDGGAIYAASTATPTIQDCTFTSNTAWDGGALYISSYGGSIERCTFEGCSASSGGALYLDDPCELALVEACLFRGNSAGLGGGVYYSYAETSFDGCTFYGNTAQFAGAGLYIHGNYNVPEVTRCSFVANDGGGVHSFMSEISFSQCIFAFDESAEGFRCGHVNYDPVITHCYSFGNAGGDSLCGAPSDNRFEDPLFCGLATGDLTLCSNSPCIEGLNPWGLDIGAHGPGGCGQCDSPVHDLSWGVLKGLYRTD